MNLLEIEKHIYNWLEENQNPYIGINRSWKEYAEENEVPYDLSYGRLQEVSQILRTKVKNVDDSIDGIMKEYKMGPYYEENN